MEKLRLYPGIAPYSEYSPLQDAPSLLKNGVAGSRGAVIVCPGGGYEIKSEYEGGPVADMIGEAGIAAFTLDYRVSPCHREAPLSDAKRAIRVVRAMGYEKVAILGFSAGGHLACSAATLYDLGNPDSPDPVERLSSRPDAFIPCYAVVTMGAYTHMGTRKALLGDLSDDLALLHRFSAEQNVTCDTPPAFLWHTASDNGVPVENSLGLASALSAHGIPFEMHIFPEGSHGLGLAPDLPEVHQWVPLLQNWLIRLGYK